MMFYSVGKPPCVEVVEVVNPGGGRIWADGYCHRCLYTPHEINVGRRMTAGMRIERTRR